MSHVVQIQTQVKDPAAIRAACRRLNLDEPEQSTVKLFSDEATGLAVKLPNWTYPVVCDTATGQLQYDNFEGRWGDQKELDRFMLRIFEQYGIDFEALSPRTYHLWPNIRFEDSFPGFLGEAGKMAWGSPV